jgi:hypothetical protein
LDAENRQLVFGDWLTHQRTVAEMLSGLVTSGLLCLLPQSGGPVAQRLEQGTHNPLVPGSNPGGPSLRLERSEKAKAATP